MLRARVITALGLLGALLSVLFWLPMAAADAALAVLVALAAWEWAGLMRSTAAGRVVFAVLTLLACWVLHGIGAPAYLMLWSAAALFWLLPAGLWLRYRWALAGKDVVAYGLGLLLIVAAWAAMVALHARGPWVLLGAMALAWVADIAAYFAGRAWGRHKLAPQISPGKTWEGVAGAVVGVLIYGICIAALTGRLAASTAADGLLWALLLLVLTAAGIVGDLFESLLKRQVGVKDSSALLPGHGGILDRIDSLLAILPLAALIADWNAK